MTIAGIRIHHEHARRANAVMDAKTFAIGTPPTVG
jgi:hypothetical protein